MKNQPRILYTRSQACSDMMMPDCDCACVLTPRIREYQLPENGLWQRTSDVEPLDISAQNGFWRALFNPHGAIPVIVLNKAAQRILASFTTPATFEDAGFQFKDLSSCQVNQTARELARIGLIRPYDSFSALAPVRDGHSDTLSAWLHLTSACNLECPYCYVEKSERAMDRATIESTLDSLIETARSQNYHGLLLKYAGGEPTMREDLLRYAHRYATDKARSAGLSLDAVVLTNGVALGDALLVYLADHGIRVSVSLDGGRASHNRLRRLGDGEGTYDYVLDTIDRACTHGLVPYLSITLTSLNLEDVVEAVRYAMERDLPFNINFVRDLSNSVSVLVPDSTRLVHALEDIVDTIAAHLDDYSHPLSGFLDRSRFDVAHTRCCSAGRDYLVIDSNGQVAPCQMLVDRPWLEEITSQSLERIRHMWAERLNLPVDSDSVCESCPWRYVCGGGCPLLRGTPLHEEYCNVYRKLYPKVVELEGARLLSQWQRVEA